MGLLIKKHIEPTFERSVRASFENKSQQALEKLSRETRDLFPDTPATDEDIRMKLEDERVFEIGKH